MDIVEKILHFFFVVVGFAGTILKHRLANRDIDKTDVPTVRTLDFEHCVDATIDLTVFRLNPNRVKHRLAIMAVNNYSSQLNHWNHPSNMYSWSFCQIILCRLLALRQDKIA
jgi:hypothetical protein